VHPPNRSLNFLTDPLPLPAGRLLSAGPPNSYPPSASRKGPKFPGRILLDGTHIFREIFFGSPPQLESHLHFQISGQALRSASLLSTAGRVRPSVIAVGLVWLRLSMLLSSNFCRMLLRRMRVPEMQRAAYIVTATGLQSWWSAQGSCRCWARKYDPKNRKPISRQSCLLTHHFSGTSYMYLVEY
jgi:hypothetical protein